MTARPPAVEETIAPTSAYASAAIGTLTITAVIRLGSGDTSFLGGWSSPAASCGARRRVVVDGTLTYPADLSGSEARVFRVRRSSEVANCGERGPSLGLTFSARDHRLSRPQGPGCPVATFLRQLPSPTDGTARPPTSRFARPLTSSRP